MSATSSTPSTRSNAKAKAKAKAKPKSNSNRAEANRRNARKSTGPRTAEGKDRSKFNAVKHGMTARSALLPGEDAAELLALQTELADDLKPRNQLEARLVARIGGHIFRSDCAERSADGLAAHRIRHEPLEQARTDKEEALDLGQNLLWKPASPLPLDPGDAWTLNKPLFAGEDVHPYHTARLLLRLEQTVPGCDWLIDRWTELYRRLNVDGLWRPAEAFKMIRLMGKHAIDLEDDFDVARVLLCSLTLTVASKRGPESGPFDWISALVVMLLSYTIEETIKTAAEVAHYCKSFKRRLAELPLAKLAPDGDVQAREWLTLVIESELQRVCQIRAVLQEIARADADEAPARLAYETGPEGDKYRRYILSNERLVNRTVAEFLNTRKTSNAGTLDHVDVDRSVARCPSSAVRLRPGISEPSRDGEPPCEPSGDAGSDGAAPSRVRLCGLRGEVDRLEEPTPGTQAEASCDNDFILRNEATVSVVVGPSAVVSCEKIGDQEFANCLDDPCRQADNGP